ncbi:MAG: tyrosine-type recombinase/integrase [Saprospiraceae bacterium]|nr:tyrosine-type recombinase/integrase [Candidatus Parvibacillus calidus]MBK7741322.1 tyrosine-type recombinase/integrase [Candidatus Parvibacillus calidus]
MKINYIVPSNLYPKKQFLLPNIMSEMEVAKLFESGLSLKEYCVVGLLYGCGMRISEVCNLRLKDIESADGRIKVSQEKGQKTDTRCFHIIYWTSCVVFTCPPDDRRNICLQAIRRIEPIV